jgi:hypothetical protein
MAPRRQFTPQELQAMNANNRAALLATAPRFRKNLNSFTGGTSQTTRIKVNNVGITTKFQLDITALLTIGTAIAVPSAKAPWNLINRLRLTDYDGTDRINVSGYQLFILNCVRNKTLFGFNNESGTAVFVNPLVPTAVGAATLQFFIDVPVAFDPTNMVQQLQDLRGAMLTHTAVGEAYLNIDWTNSLYTNNDIESVYAGAGTTTVVGQSTNYITATAWQEYLLPQNIGGNLPMPFLDLSTVYEVVGNIRTSDSLAVNSDKIISYPNMRAVVGAYFNYVSAGAVAFANLNGFKLVANANNIMREHTNRSKCFEQRLFLNTDLPAGAYFELHREKPIETSLYGNVQMYINPAVVGANAYVEVAWESFFTKGQALPGMTQ